MSPLTAERGKGYGKHAQRRLVEYLFAHTKVNRVEAGTEVTNIAEQRALERAGFTREGVLRGACTGEGRSRENAPDPRRMRRSGA
ncbi:GNAT family N-acetyltransferase [Streptomyces collinus]|uniref:GNAT family N-acetyltransferase n=1 Tax=Streptomyces collinus TaxID=42684 RepID=UPI00368CEEF1